MHRSGPANRGIHPPHPPPGLMGPPGSRGGSGSHKDIKLTLLNKVSVTPVLWCCRGNVGSCGTRTSVPSFNRCSFLFSCRHIWKQQADKSRKRYLASEKARPGSPPSKRMAFSPDRGMSAPAASC